MRGKILVFSQFFLIFLMVLPFGMSSDTLVYGVGISGVGLLVGLLALLKNRLGNFNIRPEIKEDGVLVTSGIYSYIRHPMYTSVLLFMLGVLVTYPMIYEYLLYALLVVTLLLKLYYEESLWRSTSAEYCEYCESSKRLIPYVY